LNVAKRSSEVAVLVESGDDETDGTGRVGRDRSPSELSFAEEGATHRHEVVDERKVEPNTFSLSRDGSSSTKGFLEELEVGLLEERVGGTDGIGRVGDDNVEFVLLVVQEFESVADEDGDTRIFKSSGHVRKESFRDTGNSFVDVAESCRLHLRVLENFTENTSVSSSDNENLFRVGVRSERKVSDHLLVTVDYRVIRVSEVWRVFGFDKSYENSSRSTHCNGDRSVNISQARRV
jgi:hypothetical protein